MLLICRSSRWLYLPEKLFSYCLYRRSSQPDSRVCSVAPMRISFWAGVSRESSPLYILISSSRRIST